MTSNLLTFREDHREPRDWSRPWRDRPGIVCCCNNPTNKGYSLGGDNGASSGFVTTCDRIVFSTEIDSVVSGAALSVARSEAVGVVNPSVAGYVAGGKTSASPGVLTADKTDLSTETTSALSGGNLSTGRYALAGVSERSTKAYFAGGFTLQVTADKLTFSSDTTAAQTTANLSLARGGVRGLTEGTSKGYYSGGFKGGSPNDSAVVDKLTFSSDTAAAQASANLSIARDRCQCFGDGSTKGYFAGGQTGQAFGICDKIVFSTDTTSSQTSAAVARYGGSEMSDGNVGYCAGGIDLVSLSAAYTKITFATDTSSSPTVTLSAARFGLAGLSTMGL